MPRRSTPRRTTSRKAMMAGAALLAAAAVAEAQVNRYELRDIEIVDSDTYKATVDLWPGLTQRVAVRLRGVDTPEKFRPSKRCREHERALSAKATDLVRGWFAKAERITLADVGLGKYAGRVVGTVYADGVDVAAALIETGLAVPYGGGTKTKDWCSVKITEVR